MTCYPVCRALVAISVAGLGGCASSSTPSPSAQEAGDKDAAAPGEATSAPGYTRSESTVLGRVRAVDLRTRTVVVRLSAFAEVPPGLEGRTLLSRDDRLNVTARLIGTRFQQGSSLGARLVSGRPELGDEVVLLPSAPTDADRSPGGATRE